MHERENFTGNMYDRLEVYQYGSLEDGDPRPGVSRGKSRQATVYNMSDFPTLSQRYPESFAPLKIPKKVEVPTAFTYFWERVEGATCSK